MAVIIYIKLPVWSLERIGESMGYYDEGNNTRREKGNRLSWVIPVITGIGLGALLIIFAMPALLRSDLLPYDPNELKEHVQEDHENQEQRKETVTQTFQVNVVTQVTEAVTKVSEAVVGVINIQEAGFWDEKGGQAGTGSGVIYKVVGDNAFVVTNHHVVQNASQVEVSLSDGTRVPAKILGVDIFTDLAVLQMDAMHVGKVAEFGSSDTIRLGEPVIAIGNPLGLRFAGSVTQGIISGTERSIPIDLDNDGRQDWYAEVMQTDAAINPGNSGGALVNLQGQVIGINSMKIAQEAVEGIGLAIPIDSAIPIITDLEKYGKVLRPYMGVTLRSLADVPSYHWYQTLKLPRDVESGVFIESILPMAPAERAGLQRLDVIIALDDEEISDMLDLRRYLYQNKEIGDEMKITYYRQGKLQETTMTLTSADSY